MYPGRPFLLALALALAGCRSPGFMAPVVSAPTNPDDAPRCHIAQSHQNPLVTEWSAPEKANLEALLRQGSVVVAYSGCSLRMLPSCRASGTYLWRRTTTTTDVVDIRNADELYAKMPLGAVSLEGELQRSGRLAVQTTVSGQLQLSDFSVAGLPPGGACQGASHVIRSLSIGAFKMRSGGAASAGADVGVTGFGSGRASSSSEETVIREAGMPARCELGTPEAPHAECASPIQIFLEPLPASVTDRGPPGTIKAKFLPVRNNQKWDLVVGDRTLCTTPCERWVDPAMPYSLKHDPGILQQNQYWDIPDLRPHASVERIEVRVEPRDIPEFVGGILLTTFGGISAITGTVLTAAGCGSGGKTCTAGLITLPLGLAVAAPGIWMIVDSAGTVHIDKQAGAGGVNLADASER